MAIRTRKNPYLGVNAHANSWQLNTDGEWQSFHSGFIYDLTRQLNKVLPSGFEARLEHALRLREVFPPDEGISDKSYRSRSDTTIYHFSESSARLRDQNGIASIPSRVMTALEAVPDLDDVPMVSVVYAVSGDSERPVTQIELLSPSNKPPASDADSYRRAGYEAYLDQRMRALRSGLNLIEIDLIHQQPSVLPQLGRYPEAADALPYAIIVIDPHPSLAKGAAAVYQFAVDDPFPRFAIPLISGVYLPADALDIGKVYNWALDEIPTVARKTDYAQPPLHSDTYSAADRHRIARRMSMLRLMVQDGVDLNHVEAQPIDADRLAAEPDTLPDLDSES